MEDYEENRCQLCAVSFNLSRLRTTLEPVSAGWGFSTVQLYTADPMKAACSYFADRSGCENIPGEPQPFHVSGLGCSFVGGYSGLKIGVEEMKGMNLPRYIVKRPKDAEFDTEAPEYEKESDYFLTAQCISPPTDFEYGHLGYLRYGKDDFFAVNENTMNEIRTHPLSSEHIGVPVHDACWKIFERVSNLRLGKVDLQGFMALWFRQACGQCGFQNLKQDEAIRDCNDQFWRHVNGTEYLAANPFEIPGLLLPLVESYNAGPKGYGAFWASEPGPDDPPFHQNPTDPFIKLPAELKSMLLDHLASSDITKLRLVSRSFRQLPKKLFLRLMRDEIPWFWELDDLKQLGDELNFAEQVNWLPIYQQLCILKTSVLGVKNRARIWALSEEVVRRIADLRERLQENAAETSGEAENFPVEPTKEEVEAGLVKSGFECPRCEIWQIERKASR